MSCAPQGIPNGTKNLCLGKGREPQGNVLLGRVCPQMDSEKGESHLGPWFNGVTSLLPVWREGSGKGHMGRCVGEKGRVRCDNQVPRGLVLCGSKFHVPCGLRIEASNDCVAVVAELMLS